MHRSRFDWLCCFIIQKLIDTWPRKGKTLVLTCWSYYPFFPIGYNIIPCHIVSDSIKGRQLRLIGGKHESSMFEGDNISRLWIPSLCKLCCSCWCFKSNCIGSSRERSELVIETKYGIVLTYNSHSQVAGVICLIIRASASLYFYVWDILFSKNVFFE